MLLEIVLLVLSFSVGVLIAWLARDELIIGRKWFIILIAFAALVGITSLFLKKSAIVLTCVFILIVTSISLWKSYDKKWTKMRVKERLT